MATELQTRSLTSGQVVKRIDALDYNFLGQLLPNPDPILKATGRDIRTYRDLSRDSHVGACIRRRKSAVKALEWGIDRGLAPSRVSKAVADMIAGLDMERIIGNVLDAALYGYAPHEIDWQSGSGRPGAGTWAADVVALPPEWFCFDADNALRFKTRTSPIYGELLPDRKFLLPRQDATYQNPYGQGDLALCYWPAVFMKGGLKFWLEFAEKYGGAFLFGKLPRGAELAERNAMLDGLEAIVRNGIGVVPDDGSVGTIEASGKSASANLYEQLVLYCRGQISIVLTGTNQTVEATANKASAHAGMDVAGDLRDGDAEIVVAAVTQLIRWTVDINYPGAAYPTFSLWDQTAKDEIQAARDKSNHEAGANFTRSFWVRNYGYQESDLADSSPPPTAPQPAPLSAAAFAEAALQAAANPDPSAADSNALAQAAERPFQRLIDQVQALVSKAPDMAALQRALTLAYGDLDTAELVRLQAAAYALAQLKGMDAVRSESA